MATAIVKVESFIAGFNLPVFLGCHFLDRIWEKVEKSKRLTPSATSHILDGKRNKNRMSYVRVVEQKFPTMLHLLYRFATKLLGIDETSLCLAEVMNLQAQELFPDCPIIRSNLRINQHKFWEFFRSNRGKLKTQKLQPRLIQKHIENRKNFAEKWIKN